MKYLITALALALLSGCGAVYMSPRVTDGDGKVRILELTPQTVLAANRASYSPKELPAVFFTAAGGPSAGRGIGATPSAALEPEQRPTALTLRVPPQVPMRPYTIGIGDVLLIATRGNTSTVEELSGLLAAQNRRQGYTAERWKRRKQPCSSALWRTRSTPPSALKSPNSTPSGWPSGAR